MAYLLGWKDVLRPIRDGYRHLFPPPDTGPTPEERRKQRAIDRLKGFTYFDTFEQLEAWTEADTDPLQQANTPLLVRSVNGQEKLATADVLLCHDYAGNYHDYEGAMDVGVRGEDYACEHLQHIDVFIYFSHKLVCTPPPSWTNTLHRNGVKVLGTILIEPQTPDSEKLFRHGHDGLSFFLATQLARIVDHYGFDGWLVNIEKSFSTASWNPQFLTAFLRQLRSELGAGKQLIWYDALTASNKVCYQNTLNAENSTFAKVCGGILTNYCWNENDAADSIHEALRISLPLQHVYFGIDVWAQNATKLSQPRVTYPEYGGGGTNTGVAVAKLAELGLSAGIFAPAWTFEHFPRYGSRVERTIWDGEDLPKDMACSCGDCEKRHRPNKAMPVASFANLSNFGSSTFFFTDFTRAFGTHSEKEGNNLFGGHALHAQLGSQSNLPIKAESLGIQCPMRHRIENARGRSQLVIESCGLPSASVDNDATPTNYSQSIPLFIFNMPADGSLRLRIAYRDYTGSFKDVYFYMKISGTMHTLVQKDNSQIDQIINIDIKAGDIFKPEPRLEEIGFCAVTGDATIQGKLAEVDYICIQPAESCPSQHQYATLQCKLSQSGLSSVIVPDSSQQPCLIFNIHTESRGEGAIQHTRLCWSHDYGTRSVQGLPYSTRTGRFAYFAISLDDMFLGRAYAAEHELPITFMEQAVGHEVLVHVKGVGFDGCELANASKTIRF